MIIGDVFGQWTVTGPSDVRAVGQRNYRKRYFPCRCACGTVREVLAESLLSGKSTGCGCERAARRAEQFRTHGLRQHPLYDVWTAMHQRCSNPNNKRFADYGGRGIRVCERWSDFAAFVADMGERPRPGLSIDRRDNNGDYEPGNCRWATGKEQAANSRPRRTGKLSAADAAAIRSANGSQREIAQRFGICQSMVSQIRSGRNWSRAAGAAP